MDPITLAIMSAVLFAGLGATSSVMANRAAKQNEAAQLAAIQMQQAQIQQQATQEEDKTRDQAHQIESRIRVAAGESGIGLGGTYEALTRQAQFDESYNVGIIQQNAYNSMANSASSFQSQPRQNPLLSGMMAGLSGASTGLNLYSNVQGIRGINAQYTGK